MVQPVEAEIKLAASPAMLEQLRRHSVLVGADHATTLVTTYFDTTDGRLRRAGAALRIRDGAKGREQTLKLLPPGGSSVRRGEWNVATASDVPEPRGFPAKARAALVRLLDGASLEPLATTRIERTTRRLRHGGSVIEIAFDLGTIEAGERETRVCELELELVEGRFADILALAQQLPLGPELSWSVNSKAERCHALAFDLRPAAAHARPVKLTPGMDVAQGFHAIAWNCLEQLLANYPLVVASGDPESLHQCRVAIRRLRAAFSLIGDVVDDETSPILRAELKAVAKGLSRARDLQVLISHVDAAALRGNPTIGELQGHLGSRRDEAMQSAQALLAAGSFQRLLFELAGWIEDGEWLARKEDTGGNQPLTSFAARMLSRLRRKLRVRDGLADMPDTAQHRLRINAKKLRYAGEFFSSLFLDRASVKHRQAFARTLEQLQNSLGELNDLAVASTVRIALFEGLEPITAARLAAQFDRLLDARVKSHRKLLKAAERAMTKVAGAPAWWKAG